MGFLPKGGARCRHDGKIASVMPPTSRQIGNHLIEIEGALLVVRLSGEFKLSDIKDFYALASELCRDQEIYCIGDMVRAGMITAEARSYAVRNEHNLRIVCTAVFGISPVIRALLIMVSRAAQLFGRSSSQTGIKFFANETEARGFIAAIRAQRRASAA